MDSSAPGAAHGGNPNGDTPSSGPIDYNTYKYVICDGIPGLTNLLRDDDPGVVARENLRDGSYADPDPNQVVEWGRINARERANESERQAHFKRETAREQPLFNNGVPPPITSFGQAHKDGRSRPAPANARFDAVKFGSHERANRLERENRITQRESAQPHGSSSSALPPGGPGKGGATPRKCANCGEVGHIKTNTKLCPLLNGQRKQNDTFRDANASAAVGDSDNINKESRLAPPNAPP
ncbi:hypothetical protein AA0115_g8998 [Alternaria tenuissima]|uniref:Zinc knuckle domain-containing protein n=1 Tax=Alternaria tenuissima TaxID=119927 RepID=A0AB37W860_9PLEO|nr:hypothetical protein AA0115_g8998 [Alternaria tenuissima]